MFKWLDKTRHNVSPPSPREVSTRPFAAVLARGTDMMRAHGLQDWRLTLDHARRRAGQCDYRNKTISLSRHYVRYADEAHINDTILHEIAHALVGPRHGHDAVWRQKAREIGCTATRCHNLEFSHAKWLMSCPNGCFEVSRHRKKANMICAQCKTPVIYKAQTDV